MVNGVFGADPSVKSVQIHHAALNHQEDYSAQPELLSNQSRRSCSLLAARTEDSSSPSKDTFWHNQFKQNFYLEEEPSYAKTETETVYGASMTKPVSAENSNFVEETANSAVENETIQSATLPFIISQQVEGEFPLKLFQHTLQPARTQQRREAQESKPLSTKKTVRFAEDQEEEGLHLTTKRSSSFTPPEPKVIAPSLQDRHRQLKRTIALFWRHWRGPYFQAIPFRPKKTTHRNQEVDDIVLEKDIPFNISREADNPLLDHSTSTQPEDPSKTLAPEELGRFVRPARIDLGGEWSREQAIHFHQLD